MFPSHHLMLYKHYSKVAFSLYMKKYGLLVILIPKQLSEKVEYTSCSNIFAIKQRLTNITNIAGRLPE